MIQKNKIRAAVVIPFYKAELNEMEKRSFEQCANVLNNYDQFLVLPEDLEIKFNTISSQVRRFHKNYFKNISGYNKLMLSSSFYGHFLDYDYILIYQLDSFVFKDELQDWISKGYDYIGAPWIETRTRLSRLLKPFQSKGKKRRKPIFFKVGNGGFSLRKVKTFYNISEQLRLEVETQLEKKGEIYCNEDVFWSLKVPEYFPDFKIPDYKEAVSFAVDRKPGIALKLNNSQLPFGCHGIDKPKVVKFWAPILEKEYRKTLEKKSTT